MAMPQLFPLRPRAVTKTAAPAERKAIQYPPYLFFDLVDKYGPLLEERTASVAAYRAYWLIYACMSFRATKLVEAPLWIAEEGEDGEEWLTGDHPLAELLEQPNPDMEMQELLETLSLYLDASPRGALLLKTRDRAGRPVALYPYSGDEFVVEAATVDGIPRMFGKFRVQTAQGERDYGPDEVLYFRNVDPADPLNSVPPLQAALSRVNIGREMEKAVASAIRRAFRPGSVTSLPGNMDDDQFERFKMEMATNYAGAMNAGKNIVLEGGAKLDMLKTALDDLELGPVQGDIESAICACFKVHPILVGAKVGLESSSGFADSLGPAQAYFYDLAMFPLWSRLERAFTRGLLREIDPNPLRFIRFDKSEIRALQIDMTKRTTEASTAQRFWTRNEGRIHTGQQPFEEDDPRGDELISEGGGLDLSQFGLGDSNRPRRTDDAAPEEPEDPDDGNDQEDPDDAAATTPAKTRALTKAERIARRNVTRAVHVALLNGHATTVEIMAARALDEDRAAIGAILEGFNPAKAASQRPMTEAEIRQARKKIEDYLSGEALARWKTLSEPVVLSIARNAVERSAGAAGISFDLLQPGLLEYVQKEVGFLTDSVGKTSADIVRRELTAGLAAGETHAQMSKRIAESTGFSRDRATLIARTESTRATNGAARETMQKYAADTGLVVTKTWITAGDAKVRDEHRELDGKTVPVGEPFPNGLMEPSEPNCRCSLTMDVSVPKSARKPKPTLSARVARMAKLVAANTEVVKQLVEKPAPEPPPPPPPVKKAVTFRRNGDGSVVGAEITEIPLTQETR